MIETVREEKRCPSVPTCSFLSPIDGTVLPILSAQKGCREWRSSFNEMSRHRSISVCCLKYTISLSKAVLKENLCFCLFFFASRKLE